MHADSITDQPPTEATRIAERRIASPLSVEFWRMCRQDIRSNMGWTRPGARAMLAYRFGAWAQTVLVPVIGWLLRRLALSMHRYVRNTYGIEIYPTATIGERVTIGHQSGIVIHEYATIGDDCLIRQGVTMGLAGTDQPASPANAPSIGNGVDIGAGAVIIGAIRIGDGAKIWPNAVAMQDVPAGATLMAPISRLAPRK